MILKSTYGVKCENEDKEIPKVKRQVWVIILLAGFLGLTAVVWGQESPIPREFVTSESLTIDDVKASVGECLTSQGCKVQTVLGVHQEGNSARVYVVYSLKKDKKTVIIDLIRFNSGKWYNTSLEEFVMK